MPFEKGQSGNPAGRPKGALTKATAEIKSLAQPYGKEAVETLVILLRQGETHSVRLAAANALLDRGFGKSSQPVEHSGHLDVAMTLDRVISEMREREMSMRPVEAERLN
jgi:hypothetical protein